MNRNKVINNVLAMLGLAGLTIYIIACGSGPAFSPDDTKVLLPSVDPQTRDMGVSIYDRKSRKLEQVFVYHAVADLDNPDKEKAPLRPLWTPDGKNVFVVWPDPHKHDDRLNLAILPLTGKETTRVWTIDGIKDATERLMAPLPMVGSRLFVVTDSNRVARIDLATGQIKSHNCQGENVQIYPSSRGDRVYYSAEQPMAKGRTEIGLLDPESFRQTRLWEMEGIALGRSREPEWLVAFSRDGVQAAVLPREGTNLSVRLLGRTGGERGLPLKFEDDSLEFGNACFSAKNDFLYVSFGSKRGTNYSYGFFEVPLDGKPVRRTILLSSLDDDLKDAISYCQIDLSHDGKTLAACSTIYALVTKASFKPEDCALFLVDLTKPEHKITKVPVPSPRAPAKE